MEDSPISYKSSQIEISEDLKGFIDEMREVMATAATKHEELWPGVVRLPTVPAKEWAKALALRQFLEGPSPYEERGPLQPPPKG